MKIFYYWFRSFCLYFFYMLSLWLLNHPVHFSIAMKGYIKDHKDLWQVRLDESPFRPVLPEIKFLISEVRRVIIGSGVSTSSTRIPHRREVAPPRVYNCKRSQSHFGNLSNYSFVVQHSKIRHRFENCKN